MPVPRNEASQNRQALGWLFDIVLMVAVVLGLIHFTVGLALVGPLHDVFAVCGALGWREGGRILIGVSPGEWLAGLRRPRD